MYFDIQINFSNNLMEVRCFDGEMTANSPDRYILLQFTGLKDKNGKEIYEGDIITCYAIQREMNEEIEKGERVIVEYRNGYFYPFGYNAGWRSEVGDIEVVGNKFENPELK